MTNISFNPLSPLFDTAFHLEDGEKIEFRVNAAYVALSLFLIADFCVPAASDPLSRLKRLLVFLPLVGVAAFSTKSDDAIWAMEKVGKIFDFSFGIKEIALVKPVVSLPKISALENKVIVPASPEIVKEAIKLEKQSFFQWISSFFSRIFSIISSFFQRK